MKNTSIEAYWEILDDATLGQMQREAATEIARYGTLTGRELDDALKSVSAHKRLSELEEMGVIEVKELRACKITGREVEAWGMTGKKPVRVVGKKTAAVSRPTKAQLARCLPSLRGLYLVLMKANDPVAADVKLLGHWIADLTKSVVPSETPQLQSLPPPAPPQASAVPPSTQGAS